jgi:predicted PurR-regulated permease PerM
VGLEAFLFEDEVLRETRKIIDSAPRAARSIERSERFGQLARDFKLAERTKRFVDQVPERLQGGKPAEALRAAATRSVAYLATGVLSLFFLLYGPRLARSAIDQVRDPVHRARVEQVALGAYRRTTVYAGGTLLMALSAGLSAFVVGSLLDVPGAAPLGLWVALWDVVPLVGAAIGGLPIVLLAAVDSAGKGYVAGLVFVAYQVFENLALQRRIERRSLHLGPFITIVAGLVGIEVYGIGGGLVALLVVALTVAVVDELLPP